MRCRVGLLLAGIVLFCVGCQGLTPGKMEWVRTDSDQPRAGNVYLIRGLIGVFSTGVDALADKINKQGVRASVYQDDQHMALAREIARKYQGVKDHEPLILIGHSYGADDVVRVARVLNEHGVKVDLLVTLDATTPPRLSDNVALTYNYYQSQPTDVIPLFRGIPLKQDDPAKGKLYNMDLRKERRDLLVSGTNHINIDKNERVHAEVVQQVLAVCPPREVWVARHRANLAGGAKRQDDSAGASKVRSADRAQAAGAAQ